MHFLIFFCCTRDWVNISEYNYQRSLHIWTLHCCGCWFRCSIKECSWRKHLLYLELIQNNYTESVKCSSLIIAMRCILTFEFVQNNNNARSGFTLLKKRSRMVSNLLKRWQDDFETVKRQTDGFGAFRKETGCHPAPPQALHSTVYLHVHILT
jgi:hypothetical protein